MAASMAAAVTRRLLTTKPMMRRLISSSTSITKAPAFPTYPLRRQTSVLSHALRITSPSLTRFTTTRNRVQRSGDSAYSHLDSDFNFSDPPPTEMAPVFPGCDYEHWLVVLDMPIVMELNATKQEFIDHYIQTLASVLGSEEEAKKKIYSVSVHGYYGFGCELDEETSNKLGDGDGDEYLERVRLVIPDSYVDAENKDYGAELFVDGQIVQRSPERQRRLEELVGAEDGRQT